MPFFVSSGHQSNFFSSLGCFIIKQKKSFDRFSKNVPDILLMFLKETVAGGGSGDVCKYKKTV